jgi:gamma-polyglutamate biosynthesis protein CapC
MTPGVAVLGLALGLIFALLCYLATNVSPGGMITPGWLALVLIEDAGRAVILAAVIAVTYALVVLLRRFVILYGKRLFSAVVMVAIFLQVGLLLLFLDFLPSTFLTSLHLALVDTTTLGFIVPGLVAYQLIRQPIVPTLVAVSTVTALAYVVMLAGVLLRLFPNVGSGESAAESATPTHVATSSILVAAGVAGAGLALMAWRWVRPRRSVSNAVP